MFRGPSFIVSTMQEETTPIFKRLWYDWTQQQPGIEPTNPLGQCWVPPIVAFYDQQGLLRTYMLAGGSIRSPHPGSPRGGKKKMLADIEVSFTVEWVDTIHRVGPRRQNVSRRPVMITFPFISYKFKIFRYIYKLRNSDKWKGVYLLDDMFPEEQIKKKEARAIYAYAKANGIDIKVQPNRPTSTQSLNRECQDSGSKRRNSLSGPPCCILEST